LYFEFFRGIYNFDEILPNMQSRHILTNFFFRKSFPLKPIRTKLDLNHSEDMLLPGRIIADDPANQLTLLLLLLIEHKGKTNIQNVFI
jgi:hypothetical protein